jgi:hypothetical protein
LLQRRKHRSETSEFQAMTTDSTTISYDCSTDGEGPSAMGEEKDCDKGAAPTVKMQPQQQ